MQFFDHDTGAHRDGKVMLLRKARGAAGVDAYYAILENIYDRQAPFGGKPAGQNPQKPNQNPGVSDGNPIETQTEPMGFDISSEHNAMPFLELSLFLMTTVEELDASVASMIEYGLLYVTESGGLMSPRAAQTIEAFETRSIAGKENGKKGGRPAKNKGKTAGKNPQKPNQNPGVSEINPGVSDGNPGVSDGNPAKPKGLQEVEVEVKPPKENQKEKPPSEFSSFLRETIGIFNDVVGSSMAYFSAPAQMGLRRAFEAGRTLDDVRVVTEDKRRQWGDDPGQRRWLRPETIYGDKFESYLQTARAVQAARAEEVDLSVYA